MNNFIAKKSVAMVDNLILIRSPEDRLKRIEGQRERGFKTSLFHVIILKLHTYDDHLSVDRQETYLADDIIIRQKPLNYG